MPTPTPPQPSPRPWERQPGETSRAYSAFVMYRDMGSERSLRAVARGMYGVGKRGARQPGLATVERWSRGNGWVARVAAWNDHIEAQKRAAFLAENNRRAREQARQAAEGMGAAFDAFMANIEELGSDGAARAWERFFKAERIARGMASDVSEARTTTTHTLQLGAGGLDALIREHLGPDHDLDDTSASPTDAPAVSDADVEGWLREKDGTSAGEEAASGETGEGVV